MGFKMITVRTSFTIYFTEIVKVKLVFVSLLLLLLLLLLFFAVTSVQEINQ